MFCFVLTVLFSGVDSTIEEFKFNSTNCSNLSCKRDRKVCALRSEGEGFRLRLFRDECELLEHNCAIKDNFGYDVTEMFYCLQTFPTESKPDKLVTDTCMDIDCPLPNDVPVCGLRQDGAGFRIKIFRNHCELLEHNCVRKVNFTKTDLYICKDLEPETRKHNPLVEIPDANNTILDHSTILGEIIQGSDSQNKKRGEDDNDTDTDKNNNKPTINVKHEDFYKTVDDANEFINEGELNVNLKKLYTTVLSNVPDEPTTNDDSKGNRNTETTPEKSTTYGTESEIKLESDNPKNNDKKNIVVIHGLLEHNNVNETIDRFFAATHVLDLPLKDMPNEHLNENTRRRLIKMARPLNIYIPSLIIPENISVDAEHKPTLHSCYHKCPTKCPPTYAPVCGVPGRKAREPSLMFLNHCYMDVAQCKQYTENKSRTSLSSAYTETMFVFCLGDSMNHMYNFLPLVKTLQHMGRLPKKGRYHYRLSNLKFFNNLLNIKDPKLMG